MATASKLWIRWRWRRQQLMQESQRTRFCSAVLICVFALQFVARVWARSAGANALIGFCGGMRDGDVRAHQFHFSLADAFDREQVVDVAGNGRFLAENRRWPRGFWPDAGNCSSCSTVAEFEVDRMPPADFCERRFLRRRAGCRAETKIASENKSAAALRLPSREFSSAIISELGRDANI